MQTPRVSARMLLNVHLHGAAAQVALSQEFPQTDVSPRPRQVSNVVMKVSDVKLCKQSETEVVPA